MSLFDRAVVATLPLVPRPLVRKFASRYIAGETLSDALDTIRDLNKTDIRATLDVLGEHISRIEQANGPRDAYLEALDAIRDSGVDSNVSVKLTQLGLAIDPEACYRNIEAIVSRAASYGMTVRLDMEDSTCTDPTLDVYRRLRREYDNVGIVLQSMLRRSLRDVKALAEYAPSVRVCKGIYVEPWEVAYQEDELVSRNFVSVLEAVIEAGGFAAIATHDERLVYEGLRVVEERQLDQSRYEFQMLLGVREELRDIIVRDGHPLRVYVPFGRQWYAYSMRRMRENPRVAGLVAKAVLGMGEERSRKG